MNEVNEIRHRHCYYCGRNGYLFSEHAISGKSIEAESVISRRHEGWPNIPHGGVGMTAVIELADLLSGQPFSYPATAIYRFGGDRLFINDRVIFRVDDRDGYYEGTIVKKPGFHPYMTSRIESGKRHDLDQEVARLNAIVSSPMANSSSFIMPNFSGRIIYRTEYQPLFTTREFTIVELENRASYMKSVIPGESPIHIESWINCITGGQIHPGVQVTILDETLAWAGFFAAWQGGVTVDLEAYFVRPVERTETMTAIGICDGMYGSFTRKIVYCSGAIFSGAPENGDIVACARGRWLTRPEYKADMLKYLSV